MRKRAARFLSQPSGRAGSHRSAAGTKGSSVSLNVRTAHARSAGTANISLYTSVGVRPSPSTRPRKRSPGST